MGQATVSRNGREMFARIQYGWNRLIGKCVFPLLESCQAMTYFIRKSVQFSRKSFWIFSAGTVFEWMWEYCEDIWYCYTLVIFASTLILSIVVSRSHSRKQYHNVASITNPWFCSCQNNLPRGNCCRKIVDCLWSLNLKRKTRKTFSITLIAFCFATD